MIFLLISLNSHNFFLYIYKCQIFIFLYLISEDKTLSPYRTYFSCSKNNNILSQYFKNPCHMLKPIQYLLFEQFPLLSAWDSGFLLVITFVPINFVNYFLLVIIILLVHCLGRSDTRRKRYRAVVIQGRSATGP